MINLRGGSTCCSGPGGHTPAWFKVFQNGSFVATGNLGIGVSPKQGQGYRTSWDSYKGAFRSGYADNEWDDPNVGFFSWSGGSNSTVKGAAGFSAGAGYNVTADEDHTTAMGKFASNNGFQGTFSWSDGAPQASADTFRNTANNEFAARATGASASARISAEPPAAICRRAPASSTARRAGRRKKTSR